MKDIFEIGKILDFDSLSYSTLVKFCTFLRQFVYLFNNVSTVLAIKLFMHHISLFNNFLANTNLTILNLLQYKNIP